MNSLADWTLSVTPASFRKTPQMAMQTGLMGFPYEEFAGPLLPIWMVLVSAAKTLASPWPSHCTEDEASMGRKWLCVNPLITHHCGRRAHPLALEHPATGEKVEKSALSRIFQPHLESGRWDCYPQIRGIKRTFLPPQPQALGPTTTTFLAPFINLLGMCSPLQLLVRLGAQSWRR